MAKAIHTMIRVFDLEKSMQFYDQAFGLKECHKLDFPEFTLVYLRNDENDFEIELTLNKDQTEPYTHGDGYGHVAVCVDDLDSEHQRFVELGYELVVVLNYFTCVELDNPIVLLDFLDVIFCWFLICHIFLSFFIGIETRSMKRFG